MPHPRNPFSDPAMVAAEDRRLAMAVAATQEQAPDGEVYGIEASRLLQIMALHVATPLDDIQRLVSGMVGMALHGIAVADEPTGGVAPALVQCFVNGYFLAQEQLRLAAPDGPVAAAEPSRGVPGVELLQEAGDRLNARVAAVLGESMRRLESGAFIADGVDLDGVARALLSGLDVDVPVFDEQSHGIAHQLMEAVVRNLDAHAEERDDVPMLCRQVQAFVVQAFALGATHERLRAEREAGA